MRERDNYIYIMIYDYIYIYIYIQCIDHIYVGTRGYYLP